MDLKSTIRTVADFPVEGVRFRDITTLLNNPEATRFAIDQLSQRYQNAQVDAIATVDARGFLFSSTLAYLMGLPLILVRKEGKLPGPKESVQFSSEYRTGGMEIHVDAVRKSDKILVVDDVVATGGTLKAVAEIITKMGGEIYEFAAIVELADLGARQLLSPCELFSLVEFREDET